jgi:hypothetical protein
MSLGKILTGLVVGPVLGALIGKKKPKAAEQPLPLPVAQVRPNGGVADALARRRGSSANRKTGASGAEAAGLGGKTQLGA